MGHPQQSPNLFDYATKELSQDAVISWLLKWASTETRSNPEDQALRQCGRALVDALFAKWSDCGKVELGEQVRICILRQEKNIDVLARVDGRRVLLIEDKTNTGAHDDQLTKYVISVLDGETVFGVVSWDDLYPIYLKTGNQSPKERRVIEAQDYRVFDRADLLRVLNSYRGSSDILTDLRRHLIRWQQETESFDQWTCKRMRTAKKDALGWEGFYAWIEESYLEDRSDDWDDWGGLTSRNGGYWGVWMEPHETSKNSRFAIWIEQDRISFRLYGAKTKISVTGMDRERQYWANAFLERGEGRVVKPRRLNATKTKPMCVSECQGWIEFRKADGRIDLEGSIKNIDRAKQILLNTISNG